MDFIKQFLIALLTFDPERRRAARYICLRKLCRRWGFRVYGMNVTWFTDQDFVAAWDGFPDRTNLSQERRYCLYGLAQALSHIPGDLAECGTRWGRGSHLLLTASPSDKHLYGFDSFEGLSEPEDVDITDQQDTRKWKKHDLATDEARARENLARHDGRFTLLKGWIPDRFDEVADKRFSVVHVDVDLYQPTNDSLEFFYPRLEPGGVIICDDYGSASCPGAKKAMDEFAEKVGVRVCRLTTAQGLIFKPVA